MHAGVPRLVPYGNIAGLERSSSPETSSALRNVLCQERRRNSPRLSTANYEKIAFIMNRSKVFRLSWWIRQGFEFVYLEQHGAKLLKRNKKKVFNSAGRLATRSLVRMASTWNSNISGTMTSAANEWQPKYAIRLSGFVSFGNQPCEAFLFWPSCAWRGGLKPGGF